MRDDPGPVDPHRGTLPHHPLRNTAPAPAPSAGVVGRGVDGSLRVGRGEGPAAPLWTLPGVPPFPGGSVVPLVMQPGPPLLEPGLCDDALARRVMWAHRGAVDARHGRGSAAALAGQKVEDSKLFPLLVDAGRLCQERRIPPAAWAAWSVDVWREFNNGKRGGSCPAPVRWAWNRLRLDARWEWFLEEQQHYLGARLLLGAAHRALLERWGLLRADLERARTREEAAAAVATRFPGREYQRMVREAKVGARLEQLEVDRLAAGGDFLW